MLGHCSRACFSGKEGPDVPSRLCVLVMHCYLPLALQDLESVMAAFVELVMLK